MTKNFHPPRTFSRQKFVNHLLYTNAQELAKDCERWGKDEWAIELKKVTLKNAEKDVRSYVRSDVRSDVLSDVLSDVRSYVRSDVLSYVLSYVRSYVLSYVRSYVLSYVLKELVNAYTYAGGKLNALKVKKGVNAETLRLIEKEKNILRQNDWHTGDVCGTTHCRGGFFILTAKMEWLEKLIGSETTASMIAFVNMGEVPDFHNMDNAAVLMDIRKWAARETREKQRSGRFEGNR